ncbi:MAG: ATP-binding cassette domain-containing protein, partial [Spirochaetaceae bacterium]|nr:ATP-binding cassette domain-containing protein [Spirochaetaceae bacterium]
MGTIILENVSFKYGSPESAQNNDLVLENINLKIDAGQFVCVLGSSGCGKSTLIRLLEGLNYPTSGRVLIENEEIKGPGRDRCVVFQ